MTERMKPRDIQVEIDSHGTENIVVFDSFKQQQLIRENAIRIEESEEQEGSFVLSLFVAIAAEGAVAEFEEKVMSKIDRLKAEAIPLLLMDVNPMRKIFDDIDKSAFSYRPGKTSIALKLSVPFTVVNGQVQADVFGGSVSFVNTMPVAIVDIDGDDYHIEGEGVENVSQEIEARKQIDTLLEFGDAVRTESAIFMRTYELAKTLVKELLSAYDLGDSNRLSSPWRDVVSMANLINLYSVYFSDGNILFEPELIKTFAIVDKFKRLKSKRKQYEARLRAGSQNPQNSVERSFINSAINYLATCLANYPSPELIQALDDFLFAWGGDDTQGLAISLSHKQRESLREIIAGFNGDKITELALLDSHLAED